MKEKNEQIYERGFEEGYRMASESGPAAGRNESAFTIGLIAGLLGFWGIGHLLNDRVGTGCLWFVFGPAIAGILIAIVALITGGIGVIFAIPIWLYLVYWQANKGASRT